MKIFENPTTNKITAIHENGSVLTNCQRDLAEVTRTIDLMRQCGYISFSVETVAEPTPLTTWNK